MPMTNQQLQAELDKLRSENEALRSGVVHKLGIKRSDKGAVSVYGIHSRFPVTLYWNQWFKLLAISEQIKQFIETNKADLASK